MNEATMLYRPGGEHDIHGYKLSYVIVDAEDVPAMLDEGWFATPTQAGESVKVAPVASAEPSRAELEQKAGELGLKFDGRTGDKRLAVMIADALKA